MIFYVILTVIIHTLVIIEIVVDGGWSAVATDWTLLIVDKLVVIRISFNTIVEFTIINKPDDCLIFGKRFWVLGLIKIRR